MCRGGGGGRLWIDRVSISSRVTLLLEVSAAACFWTSNCWYFLIKVRLTLPRINVLPFNSQVTIASGMSPSFWTVQQAFRLLIFGGWKLLLCLLSMRSTWRQTAATWRSFPTVTTHAWRRVSTLSLEPSWTTEASSWRLKKWRTCGFWLTSTVRSTSPTRKCSKWRMGWGRRSRKWDQIQNLGWRKRREEWEKGEFVKSNWLLLTGP